MGTSSSYRSPPTPRWNAFVAALVGGSPADRVRSELFNAGDHWAAELSSGPVASMAQELARLFEDLPDAVGQSTTAADAVSAAVEIVRSAGHREGFSAATPLALRAAARALLTRLNSESTQPVADEWRTSRGQAASALLADFVGEICGQFAAHTFDREFANALTRGSLATAESLRRSVVTEARSIGSQAARATWTQEVLTRDAWREAVQRAFEEGRRLPSAAS